MGAVVQAEVRRDPREDHQVRSLQRVPPLMTKLQRMAHAEEPSGHPGQVGGDPQARDRVHQLLGSVRVEHHLTADHQHGALGPIEKLGRAANEPRGRLWS